MVQNMPKGWSALEQVRYLYLQLGNVFSYNRDYLHVTDPRILREIYEDFITIPMIENGNYQNKINAVCKQHARILCDTLNSNREKDIKAKTVGYVEGEENHIDVVVTVEGKNYNLNISKDLYKIQKGMKTKGFATKSTALDGTVCEILSEEEIKKMDEKNGYCKYGVYTDDILQLLRKEMEEEQNWEQFYKGKKKDTVFQYKIDFIFRHLKNNQLEEMEMGIYEVDKYYRKLYSSLLTEEEKQENKLVSMDIRVNTQGKNEKSLLYKIKNPNKNLYYIYDKGEKTFVEITPKEILKMQENGILEADSRGEIEMK